jgi:hypothetical protein
MFEDDPHAALLAGRGEDGEIDLSDMTSDPLLQKWENELSQGLTPDLTEGLSDEAKQKLKAKAKSGYKDLSIQEDYTDPRYQTNQKLPILGQDTIDISPKRRR